MRETHADQGQELVFGAGELGQGMSLDRGVRDLQDRLVVGVDLTGRVDVHQAVFDITSFEERRPSLGHEDVHLARLGDGAGEEDGSDDKEAEASEDIRSHAAGYAEEVGRGGVEGLWRGVVGVRNQVGLFLMHVSEQDISTERREITHSREVGRDTVQGARLGGRCTGVAEEVVFFAETERLAEWAVARESELAHGRCLRPVTTGSVLAEDFGRAGEGTHDGRQDTDRDVGRAIVLVVVLEVVAGQEGR